MTNLQGYDHTGHGKTELPIPASLPHGTTGVPRLPGEKRPTWLTRSQGRASRAHPPGASAIPGALGTPLQAGRGLGGVRLLPSLSESQPGPPTLTKMPRGQWRGQTPSCRCHGTRWPAARPTVGTEWREREARSPLRGQAGAPACRGLPSRLSPPLSPGPAGSGPDGSHGGRWAGRGGFLVKARLRPGTLRREGPRAHGLLEPLSSTGKETILVSF